MHAASVEGELEGRPGDSDFPRHSSPDPVALFEPPLVTSFCPFLVLALQDICVSHQGVDFSCAGPPSWRWGGVWGAVSLHSS